MGCPPNNGDGSTPRRIASLAESGAVGFKASTERGLKLAREAGLEFIDITPEEKARWEAIIEAKMQEVMAPASRHDDGQ